MTDTDNDDAGRPGLEDRIRELFAEGAADRAVSAKRVIAGARRRRIRHRATAAGSSLAVLGVAAGAIAFGGHPGGPSGSGPVVKPAASPTTAAGSKTCSASVTGTVPATTATTLDGLDFATVSGKTAGYPWSVLIHVFGDKQSHVAWEKKLPAGSIPQAAMDAEHPGATAQFRTPGDPGYSEVGMPQGTDTAFFTIQQGKGLGPGTPATALETAGLPKNLQSELYPAYVTSGWMAYDVDHMCAEYAGHVEFLPVYRIQGGSFYVFGFSADDRPQKVIGYNSAGKVVGTAFALKGTQYFLSTRTD